MIKKVLIISSILISLLVGGVAFDNYQLSKARTTNMQFKDGTNFVLIHKFMDNTVYITVKLENLPDNSYTSYWLEVFNPEYAGIDFVDKDLAKLGGKIFRYSDFVNFEGVKMAQGTIPMDKKTYRKIKNVKYLLKGGN